MINRHFSRPIAIALAVTALGACSTSDNSASTSTTEATSAAQEAQESHGPQRIVASSEDVAAAALSLVGAQHVIAVPESLTNPATSNVSDEAKKVETKLPAGAHSDPEQILSLKPDAVLITMRHEGEKDSATALENANVPVTMIDNRWATIDEFSDNLTTVGKAVGAEDKANKMVSDMKASIDKTTDKAAKAADSEQAQGGKSAPRVVTLMYLAGKVMIIGPDSISSDLITRAHGKLAAQDAGVDKTRAADAELLARINPDVIVLVDNKGKGREPYAELLDNPAVAGLQHREAIIKGNHMLPSAGEHIADGYAELVAAMYPDAK